MLLRMRLKSNPAFKTAFYSAVLLLFLSGCATFKPLNSFEPDNATKISGHSVFPALVLPVNAAFKAPSSERLPAALPPVTLTTTPEVNRELMRYLRVHYVGLDAAFERRAQYLPMMEAIFRDEGLPAELLALPIIESGFDVRALSPVGARGLWQFMPATARHYGLVVNAKTDDRLDPVLSTIAAAKFLRDLYKKHGDWHLALAAYNAGSGGVTRALTRTRSTDYWQLARAQRGLSLQTQQFVPKFLAAAAIARRWNRYDAVELAADPTLLLSGMHPGA